MKIHNFKIGTRLALGFGALLAMLALIIGLGIARLGDLNAGMNAIVLEKYTEVLQVQSIVNDNNVMARVLRNMALASDAQTIEKNRAIIVEKRQAITDTLSKLEPRLQSGNGKPLFDAVKDARAAYLMALDQVLRFLADGKKEEAANLLLTGPTAARMGTAIGDLIAYESEQMESSRKQADATYRSARNMMSVVGLLALVFGGCMAWLIARSITRPLNQALHIAQTVAAGDLTSRIDVNTRDETGQLLRALNDMNVSLQDIVGQVRTGTDTIATASSQISSGNLDLSSRTEQQASSLEETASAVEELTSTVKQNGDNARQANALALSASDVAVKGGAIVSHVVETMGSINESSRKIVDIIGVIDGIAFQTNILALNAAVEAARAGEQGRGFAVVATEVRNLAQRSASAAREIKALIGDSVDKVEIGSKLVNEAGSTMDEIVASVKRVTDIMGEITSASLEQEAGIDQIHHAITEMDGVTQQNAALVEEAAAAAASLHEQADTLANVVRVFKLDAGHAGRPVASAARVSAPVANTARASTPAPKKALPVKLVASKSVSAKPAADGDWEEF
jgi:methyl-accepting chemotaxis protein